MRNGFIGGRLSSLLEITEADGSFSFLIKSMVKRGLKDDIGGSAVQMAYYILFSFFPLLIFVHALIGLLNLRYEITEHLATLLIPGDIMELSSLYLSQLSGLDNPTMLVFGICTALWSFSRAVKYLILALNRAYRIRGSHHTARAGIMALFFTVTLFLCFIVLVVLLVAGGSFFEAALSRLNLHDFWLLDIWEYLRWGIICLLLLLTLASLYFLIPGARVPFRHALPGTLFAFCGWLVGSVLFSYYVNNLARYSIIYGSLGAVIVFMVWLFITGSFIIYGGQLNHVLITLRHRKRGRR